MVLKMVLVVKVPVMYLSLNSCSEAKRAAEGTFLGVTGKSFVLETPNRV